MKPRRTVASVVGELISGLRSGEITVNGLPAEQASGCRHISWRDARSPDIKRYLVTAKDLRSACGRAKERLWLYVGDLPPQPEILNMAAHRQPQQVRILVSSAVQPQALALMEKHGVKNVRIVECKLKDQIALADDTVFVLETPTQIARLDEESLPQKFHEVEQFFQDAWEAAFQP